MLDFDSLASTVAAHGGASVNLEGSKPKRGFMVSSGGCCQVLEGLPSARDLRDYRRKFCKQLAQSGAFLGAWVENGRCFLDVSRCVKSEHEALAVARQNEQLAYFDLSGGASVRV
jgi:hypothetical protein